MLGRAEFDGFFLLLFFFLGGIIDSADVRKWKGGEERGKRHQKSVNQERYSHIAEV
jgi:hypothetical protein